MGGHYASDPIMLATTVTSIDQAPADETATTGLRVASAAADQGVRIYSMAKSTSSPPTRTG